MARAPKPPKPRSFLVTAGDEAAATDVVSAEVIQGERPIVPPSAPYLFAGNRLQQPPPRSTAFVPVSWRFGVPVKK